MVEWHVTPDYIINNWTDELLQLMIYKLEERKERESDITKELPPKQQREVISDTELFSRSSNLIKWDKKIGD